MNKNIAAAEQWEIIRMIEYHGHARYGFHRYDLTDHALKMHILKANRPAASRFAREDTFSGVMKVFFKNRLDVIKKAMLSASEGDKLMFSMRFTTTIGYGYCKNDDLSGEPKPTNRLAVVLRKTEFENVLGFQLVTAYPEMR